MTAVVVAYALLNVIVYFVSGTYGVGWFLASLILYGGRLVRPFAIVMIIVVLAPTSTAIIPFTFEAYEGDVNVSTDGCEGRGAARLDIAFQTTNLVAAPTRLQVDGPCEQDLLMRAVVGGDGGYVLLDATGTADVGTLGTNGGFPVGNGTFWLWLDLPDPVQGTIHVFGDYLLPAQPISGPIP